MALKTVTIACVVGAAALILASTAFGVPLWWAAIGIALAVWALWTAR